MGQRGGEGVGQRILGSCDVAGPCREEGDEPAVALPGHRFGGGAGVVADSSRRDGYISQIGRTSTAPCAAAGQRAAQVSAWSRSGTSMT